jgi:hypothetical protein
MFGVEEPVVAAGLIDVVPLTLLRGKYNTASSTDEYRLFGSERSEHAIGGGAETLRLVSATRRQASGQAVSDVPIRRTTSGVLARLQADGSRCVSRAATQAPALGS